MNPLRTLSVYGWLALAAAAVVAIAAVLWFAGAPARRQVAAARAQAEISAGQVASGAAAAEIVAAGAARDAATDRFTQENAHALDQAPGADQRLDPRLNDVGRRGLCGYAAYRDTAECLQLVGPGQSPKAD